APPIAEPPTARDVEPGAVFPSLTPADEPTSAPPTAPAVVEPDSVALPAARAPGLVNPSAAPNSKTAVPLPPLAGSGSPASGEGTAEFLARGDSLLSVGDVASARLFYERAVDAGTGLAAVRLGETFDPLFLDRARLRGVRGDPGAALFWYRRARDLGAA